ISVLGDPSTNDCWIEDGSIASYSMLLQAEDLGLGGCWVQMRARGLNDGTPANDIVRGILNIPENLDVLCVLGFGHKAIVRQPQNEDRLKWENVRIFDAENE
ncbi:MAG: nitroreductase family protein, partial [Prevotellaceae bacterium]|nr:nitroreductase family protein [Prevotellaceae bacterium]